MKTLSGKNLQVIDPGVPNWHSGPDYLCALIRMEGLVWAGNVEIHVKASDWYHHGHHLDPAYDNVILHIAGRADAPVRNSRGRLVETAVLSVSETMIVRYRELLEEESWLPCFRSIRKVPGEILKQWFRVLFEERNASKLSYLRQIGPVSEEWQLDRLFFILMARGFGLPVNGLPMELMARRIPYLLLQDSIHDLYSLESLFFGLSGLLPVPVASDPYAKMLSDRFSHISAKWSVASLYKHIWKYMRIRPASFPPLRIAQLAALLHFRYPVRETVLSCRSHTELIQLLRIRASPYWDRHYLFGKSSPALEKYTGLDFRRGLLINVIVPFLEATEHRGNKELTEEILSEMKAESNHIIKNWRRFGIKPDNALEGQALIQLHQFYCCQRRCIECRLGRRYLLS